MLVTVATFNKPEPAEAVAERLDNAGIPPELVDEEKLQRYWLLTIQPLANVRLKVPKEQFTRSMQLLHEWDAKEGILSHAIRCPECGSSRIEYPQFTRKFILPAMLSIFCRLGIIKPEFFCEDCQYTWPPTPEQRAL